jgi:hypothetical protein
MKTSRRDLLRTGAPGAVSGNRWRGARDGFEEGWALLELRGDEVSWRYMDCGWEVEEEAAAAAS